MSKSTASKKGSALRTVTTRLKGLQTSFDNIHSFVERFNEHVTASDVQVRLERLDILWEQINDTINEVLSHSDFHTDPSSIMEERSLYENQFYDDKSFLMDKHKMLQDTPILDQTTRTNTSFSHGSTPHARLPQITLPKFSGNIDEWISFRDLYTSLIHWQAYLPDVEKLHYLRSQLQGEALSVIEALPITSANYITAWELLVKRYSNLKVIKRKQIQGIFDLQLLKKESAGELHTLLENFERILKTLDQLVQPADYKDLLLLHILSSKLDSSTRRSWEEHTSSKDSESLKDLTDFLARRVRVLEALPSKGLDQRHDTSQPMYKQRPSQQPRASYSAVQQTSFRCSVCSENHPLYKCKVFGQMAVSEREGVLRTHALCRNCFHKGHQAKDCNSKVSCRKCKARHHTIVCFKAHSDSRTKNNAESEDVASGKSDSGDASETRLAHVAVDSSVLSATCSSRIPTPRVLLATAMITIKDDAGVSITARALLDSGSQCNFVSRRLCQRFKLHQNRVQVPVVGIGQSEIMAKYEVQLTISSRTQDFTKSLALLVLPKITVKLPISDIDINGWNIPTHLKLSDSEFNRSKPVDLILGGGSFFDFFSVGQSIELGERLPKLIDSVFGWVVAGEYNTLSYNSPRVCNTATTATLEELLPRFWSCEEIGLAERMSPQEARCEEQFSSTVKRALDGRYIVTLPKDEKVIAKLGESKETAFKRLQGLERRLGKDPILRKRYDEFLMEYLKLGHMKKVNVNEDCQINRVFLPHHPVVKESSTTTKVRVVFDASCKTATGISLNDGLVAGPVIQDDLRSIIFRCRTRQIMVIADVEKMFRQVIVASDDRWLQNILWRFDSKEPPSTYELTTVTYGTKPAPYLATRALQQLTIDEAHKYPLTSKSAREDVYMDDLISGADDMDSASELCRQLVSMMDKGGFHLRKWASNCPAALQDIPKEDMAIQNTAVELDPDPEVRTLGLIWLPSSDSLKLHFNVPLVEVTERLTKRKVLSIIAALFDPLGLVGATVTMAKLFMQLLWTLPGENSDRLEWDDFLPAAVELNWRRFHAQLPALAGIRIARCVMLPKMIEQEIHVFCDASEKAYGACLYLKSVDESGQVMVSLMASKSRVALLKSQSLPRLELCGALIAAELFDKVRAATRFEGRVYFWTDSTTVLQWLKSVPTTWTTFVANRVSKIQSLTETARWCHVPGIQNPADLISRGMFPEELVLSMLWWHGPSWVNEPSKWPDQPKLPKTQSIEAERKRTVVALGVVEDGDFYIRYFQSFSNYTDLIRKTAYWCRYFKNLKNKVDGTNLQVGFLTSEELKQAEWTLIRRIQQAAFEGEWKMLQKGEGVSRSSRIKWFNPFISKEDQVIRVGGRLTHSRQTEEAKHPAVLPARHHFTRLLLLHYHQRLLHAGPQLLLATSSSLWVICRLLASHHLDLLLRQVLIILAQFTIDQDRD
ncbi:uncharacterized protein LOC131680903 [Topomyia yanbarensis]|uniref:uncharacterized protein LOC131680903 n=1 Tax=Topomyia yanbarensis TaxID=2498891 RepID=UPI00273CED00|nr:uncharacterized protein LOC131680903 [Topomyia yanbarensis]